ncbi:MAG: HNH endonuclease [Planctomycetes bacterium]|nr:HNH endonuclease [Planctomycetota bacterium]
MRSWWVNQNQTFRQEQLGGYMWSPKRNANGHRNRFYDTMREVAPGDLVLSFEDQFIRSIGIVRSYCYEFPKPPEFEGTGLNWSRIGWRVDVHWVPLTVQIRPKDHIDRLRPHLPERYSPLQRDSGYGLQGVYLAEVPRPLLVELVALIGYQAQELAYAPQLPMPERVGEHLDATEEIYSTWESREEQALRTSAAVSETDRVALILSRRGQGLFRRNVRSIERACRVTGVDNPEHLIASHCKPWRHADNSERLDGENGLLLTPAVDHLFDRGFISFEDNGELLVSPVADTHSLARMGISPNERVRVGAFSAGQRHYLEYHRSEILLSTDRH